MNINDILTRFRTDPEFAAKYTNLNGMDAIQSQLKSDGYDVSLDDIRSGIGQLQGTRGELSEADLAGVAGGTADWPNPKKCPRCGSKNVEMWHCEDCGFESLR